MSASPQNESLSMHSSQLASSAEIIAAARLNYQIAIHNAGYTAELRSATRFNTALIQVHQQLFNKTGSNQEDINALSLNFKIRSASLADREEEIGAANLNGAGRELNEALANTPSEPSPLKLFSKTPGASATAPTKDASSEDEDASLLPLLGPKS